MEFSKDIIAKVSELQIHAKRSLNSLLSGNYRSSFRGSGMQFKEFRRYEPGDDIRHMSWPVTARTGHATIKTYEEERELDVLLLVDVSGSSLFGYEKKTKRDMYAELVALIGLATIRSGDNFGCLLFNDKPELYLPPKKHNSHVLRAVASILGQDLLQKGSNLNPALLFAHNVRKTKSILIVISDFLVPTFDEYLTMLSSRHEVVLLHCLDDAERGNLKPGVYEVWDPETGDFHLLDAYSKSTREGFAKYHIDKQHHLEQLCRNSRSDYLSLSVEDDYLQRLVHFFRRRGPSHI